jgi:hypothetical protein
VSVNVIEKTRTAYRKVPLLLWLIAGLFLLGGILLVTAMLPSGPTASGMVRLDDQPISEGWIRYIPVEGTPGSVGGASIHKGKYRVEKGLTEGKYKVEIQATRLVPGRKDPNPVGGEPIQRIETIPLAELDHPICQVGPGRNTYDFQVKEKKGTDTRKRP